MRIDFSGLTKPEVIRAAGQSPLTLVAYVVVAFLTTVVLLFTGVALWARLLALVLGIAAACLLVWLAIQHEQALISRAKPESMIEPPPQAGDSKPPTADTRPEPDTDKALEFSVKEDGGIRGEPELVLAQIAEIQEQLQRGRTPSFRVIVQPVAEHQRRAAVLTADNSKSEDDERELGRVLNRLRDWQRIEALLDRATHLVLSAPTNGWFTSAKTVYLGNKNLTECVLGIRDGLFDREPSKNRWWLRHVQSVSETITFGLSDQQVQYMQEGRYEPHDGQPGLRDWKQEYSVLYLSPSLLYRRAMAAIALFICGKVPDQKDMLKIARLSNLDDWKFALTSPEKWLRAEHAL